MSTPALLMKLMTNPAVTKATELAATEVLTRGFVDSIEYVLDRAAYAVAKKIVENERKQKGK